MNRRLTLSAGTVLQSRYTIVGQLGHGAMGAVYEAKDSHFNVSVALKETFADDDITRKAFEREGKMLANLSHEAFPDVKDYFEEGDGFYLVMELIRGKDLKERLKEQNAPFETQQVLMWADQILDALEDLHSQNIFHRDIKPSNLKATQRGRIKLLDFGLVKGATGDMEALESIDRSLAAATLEYAPIEQVLRADLNQLQMLCVGCSEKALEILDHGTDARSDLYALGATLYHLLTNTLPVNAPTRALSIWTGQPDKLRPAHEINPHLSPAISLALESALGLERDDRVASATEFRRLLNQAGIEVEFKSVVADKKKTVPLLSRVELEKPYQQQIETEVLEIDALETITDLSSEAEQITQLAEEKRQKPETENGWSEEAEKREEDEDRLITETERQLTEALVRRNREQYERIIAADTEQIAKEVEEKRREAEIERQRKIERLRGEEVELQEEIEKTKKEIKRSDQEAAKLPNILEKTPNLLDRVQRTFDRLDEKLIFYFLHKLSLFSPIFAVGYLAFNFFHFFLLVYREDIVKQVGSNELLLALVGSIPVLLASLPPLIFVYLIVKLLPDVHDELFENVIFFLSVWAGILLGLLISYFYEASLSSVFFGMSIGSVLGLLVGCIFFKLVKNKNTLVSDE